jgi:hypothetical protein
MAGAGEAAVPAVEDQSTPASTAPHLTAAHLRAAHCDHFATVSRIATLTPAPTAGSLKWTARVASVRPVVRRTVRAFVAAMVSSIATPASHTPLVSTTVPIRRAAVMPARARNAKKTKTVVSGSSAAPARAGARMRARCPPEQANVHDLPDERLNHHCQAFVGRGGTTGCARTSRIRAPAGKMTSELASGRGPPPTARAACPGEVSVPSGVPSG